jgi:hypothetical protein
MLTKLGIKAFKTLNAIYLFLVLYKLTTEFG